MKLKSGVLLLGIVAVMVILATAYVGWDRIAPRFAGRRPLQRALPGAPNAIGGRVDISAGIIEVKEFSRFLQDFTGLTVIVDADTSQSTIEVVAPIRDADPEILRALLEANGVSVELETLPGGKEILRVQRRPTR